MSPATTPPSGRDAVRLLAVDPASGRTDDLAFDEIAGLLGPGDLLVVNDAATLPASLCGTDTEGRAIELRLVAPVGGDSSARWKGVLFGAGDWRARTEDRPLPPENPLGARFRFGRLGACLREVSPISPRLVELEFDRAGESLLAAFYEYGRPVQYSYLEEELELWSFQTVYGGRPWAVEMPSAGRPLTWGVILTLRERGVDVVALTHAAGLSATGDARLDAALPLPERFEIPQGTVDAIERARARGGRVIAVGTTVVRAIEGAASLRGGQLVAGTGETDLVIDDRFTPAFVDGLLTGMHEPSESHFRLLSAFAPRAVLERWVQEAIALGYRTHEFGDVSLILAARPGVPSPRLALGD
jgi:S-adenosylmethionine:tRNA ribosyltransferase-isomerase